MYGAEVGSVRERARLRVERGLLVLTVEQHAALAALTRAGELTSPELARVLGVGRLHARHLLLALVEQGHARASRGLRGRVVYRAST